MKMSRIKKHRRVVAATLMASAVLAASVALAEDVWVKTENVDIRAGKGAVFPVVKTVPKGTQLNVDGHEGNWLKVHVGDAQGYVFQNAISSDKVGGDSNLLANVGSGNGSDLSTGAAAKGLSESAETYASGKRLDPRPLQRLVDFRKQIDPKDWEQFTVDGKVGPEAP